MLKDEETDNECLRHLNASLRYASALSAAIWSSVRDSSSSATGLWSYESLIHPPVWSSNHKAFINKSGSRAAVGGVSPRIDRCLQTRYFSLSNRSSLSHDADSSSHRRDTSVEMSWSFCCRSSVSASEFFCIWTTLVAIKNRFLSSAAPPRPQWSSVQVCLEMSAPLPSPPQL